jgi:hypothetical protein
MIFVHINTKNFNITQIKPCTCDSINFLLDQKVTKNQDKTKLRPALSNRKNHGNVCQNETSIESYNLRKAFTSFILVTQAPLLMVLTGLPYHARA